MVYVSEETLRINQGLFITKKLSHLTKMEIILAISKCFLYNDFPK